MWPFVFRTFSGCIDQQPSSRGMGDGFICLWKRNFFNGRALAVATISPIWFWPMGDSSCRSTAVLDVCVGAVDGHCAQYSAVVFSPYHLKRQLLAVMRACAPLLPSSAFWALRWRLTKVRQRAVSGSCPTLGSRGIAKSRLALQNHRPRSGSAAAV